TRRSMPADRWEFASTSRCLRWVSDMIIRKSARNRRLGVALARHHASATPQAANLRYHPRPPVRLIKHQHAHQHREHQAVPEDETQDRPLLVVLPRGDGGDHDAL